ncbi:Glycosyltransferase [Cupriavidus necator]|uniref:Glycosyltransferase n=1 Tax=Cupriavidus necator TaxID=106590 RepID=A0A1K0JEX8_CUPNE|nr:Glycosyltransferase [Cupriavidus necator]
MIKSSAKRLVSIITPVHNDGKYIGATAISILQQSLTDFEWILVDDGSNGETAGVLARLAASDARIRIITNPVAYGPARARNIGIAAASGEYVAFLDADDIWDANKLEQQVTFMRNHDLDFSYHDYIPFEDGSGRPLSKICGPNRLTLFSHNARRGVGCLAVMLKRKIAGDGVFPAMPPGLVAEDFAAWAILIKGGLRGERLPKTLAWYRVRKRSFSSNKFRSAHSVWFIMRTMEGFGKVTSAFFLASFLFTAMTSRVVARVSSPYQTLAAPPWH